MYSNVLREACGPFASPVGISPFCKVRRCLIEYEPFAINRAVNRQKAHLPASAITDPSRYTLIRTIFRTEIPFVCGARGGV